MLPSIERPKRGPGDEIPFLSPKSMRSGSAPMASMPRGEAEELLEQLEDIDNTDDKPAALENIQTLPAAKSGKAKLKKVAKRRRNSLTQVTATMAARAAEAKKRIEAIKSASALREQKLNERSSSSMASASKVGRAMNHRGLIVTHGAPIP